MLGPHLPPPSPKLGRGGDEEVGARNPQFSIINAADGCAFARQRHAVAIVVDTLRASTTVAILLERAAEVIVVRTVTDARALAAARPGSLLVGERHGLPPEGFDLGNSPIAARYFDCTGRTIIFTSTTGAARSVAVVGNPPDPLEVHEAGQGKSRNTQYAIRNTPHVPALFMGAPVNARAVAQAARAVTEVHQSDVVIIPAGHVDDDHGTGPEDAAGATVIGLELQALGMTLAPGSAWAFEVSPPEQLPFRAAEMIRTSPHAHLLYALGPEFTADVDFCGRFNETATVPRCVGAVPLASGEVGVVFAA